jgi:hypothetical protein
MPAEEGAVACWHIASLRCYAAIRRLSRHSGLWRGVGPADLWAHGLVRKGPSVEPDSATCSPRVRHAAHWTFLEFGEVDFKSPLTLAWWAQDTLAAVSSTPSAKSSMKPNNGSGEKEMPPTAGTRKESSSCTKSHWPPGA